MELVHLGGTSTHRNPLTLIVLVKDDVIHRHTPLCTHILLIDSEHSFPHGIVIDFPTLLVVPS